MKTGDLLRDGITGFEGVAIAEVNWLEGRKSFILQSRSLHEGIPVANQMINENQLSLVLANCLTLTPAPAPPKTATARAQ